MSLSRRQFLQRGAFVASATVLPYALVDKDLLEVRHQTLSLPRWDLGKVRVAVMADFHIYQPLHLELALRALAKAAQAKPDLILLPGDFMDSSGGPALKLLRSYLRHVEDLDIPAFATLGNHDLTTGQPYWALREFAQSKVQLLRNEWREWNGITIGGLDDALFGDPQPEVFADPRFSKNTVMLVHEPDVVDRMPPGPSLQVSGHTHGGQICLPFGYPLWRPFLGEKYTHGWFPDTRIPMYVTRGVGTTEFHCRMFCRPEVSILDLVGA